jgi:hypothetical protein
MSDKHVDEDWKRKAREEKERLSRPGAEAGPGGEPEAAAEAREPSFSMIVSSFVAQALISLGDMPNPVDGKRIRDLEAAKFSIDMLQILLDKTQGNLTDEENAMLSGALYDLRMRYVSASS